MRLRQQVCFGASGAHRAAVGCMNKRASNLAVWIDQRQARIVRVGVGRTDISAFGAEDSEDFQQKHRVAGDANHDRRDRKRFFARIAHSICGAKRILLLGPSTAKLDFARYLRKHAHSLERKVVGIETMDQPVDGQLRAFTQEYFPAKHRHEVRPSS